MAAAAFVINSVALAVQIYARSYYDKTPHHTSILTGEMWVTELLNGHPDRIKSALGMRHNVFLALVQTLGNMGLQPSRYISLEEHVAIFLY
ncbi:hypothetical protein BDN70DRAFT_770991, partial [Pholiota conissans]